VFQCILYMSLAVSRPEFHMNSVSVVQAIEKAELPFTRWHCLLYRHIQRGRFQLAVFAARGEELVWVKLP